MKEQKNKEARLKGADLKKHQSAFDAMRESCDSPIPAKILSSFTLLQELFPEDYGVLEEDNATFYYHLLWEEYTKYWSWPFFTPPIKMEKIYKKSAKSHFELTGTNTLDKYDRMEALKNQTRGRKNTVITSLNPSV